VQRPGLRAVDITRITFREWPWWYREWGIEEYEDSREFCVSEKENQWRGEVGVLRNYERNRHVEVKTCELR